MTEPSVDAGSSVDEAVQTRRPPPRRGRPPILHRDDIVDAAVTLGFADLSMPRVAGLLNVRHSALYRYFPSRDLLVAAAIDRIADGIEWPGPMTASTWRPVLHATFRTLWTVLAEHPGLAHETSAARLTTNRLLSRVDTLPLDLVDVGFAAPDALQAVYTMVHFTLGNAILTDEARAEWDGATGDSGHLELAEDSAVWADERTHDAFVSMIGLSVETWFDTQLDLILDGVAARRDARAG